MKYMSTPEAGKKWGISKRRAAILCGEGRIPGAVKTGNTWLIPADAEKPEDLRKKEAGGKRGGTPESRKAGRYFPCVLASMRTTDPEQADTEEMRAQLESELALFGGDPLPALNRYKTVKYEDPFFFCVSLAAMSASVVSGDYEVFSDILKRMKGITETETDARIRRRAWLVYTTATVSMNASGMGEEWAENADLGDVSGEDIPWVIYIRAKIRANRPVLKDEMSICETALPFLREKDSIGRLYLLLGLASAACTLGENARGEKALEEAVRIAKPRGILVPFAESATHYGEGLVHVFDREWKDAREKLEKASERITENWIHTHNRFTHDNMTTLLTVREYRLAKYLVLKYSYRQIAELMHYSEGGIRNRISELYTKLSIRSRDELEGLIWT